MKVEVKHHPDSEKFIKETFNAYKEIDELPKFIENCIIHIYPKSDTIVNGIDNDLEGYIDAYNCELHVYDCKNKTVYKSKLHDEVMADAKCKIRIFKDLSTMVIFNEPVKFISGQSLWVMPVIFNKRFIWLKYQYKSEVMFIECIKEESKKCRKS